MENKVGLISLISLVLGLILFFFDRPIWYLSILFFAIAVIVPLTKMIWGIAGWASDKVEELK